MTDFTFAQLMDLWVKAGGDPNKAGLAAAVAMAESGGPPYKIAHSDAVSSAGARGLWQIIPLHGSISSLDPLTNARGAVQISSNGTNWRAWDSAFSDNLRGTSGGTYLGPGSMVLAALAANGIDASHLPNPADVARKIAQDAGSVLNLALPDQVTGFFRSLEKPLQALMWLLNPTSWARILAGLFGVLLLAAGLVALGKAA